MKKLLTATSCMLWLAIPVANACEYVDDARMSDEQFPGLAQELIAGKPVKPVQIRVGTYLQLGEQSRQLLEPHLTMHDVNCAPVAFFDGELLGRPVIPFEEYYRVMAQAIHDDRPDVAKSLFGLARAAPLTVQQVQSMFSMMPFPGTHGLQTRERMQEIFPQFKRTPPLDKHLSDPLKDGRPNDYAMFKLFQVFGGGLVLDKGCGPYELNPSLIRTERVFGRDVQFARREPFHHMMGALGYRINRETSTSYRIGSCN